jgi:Domain of unknown function (DUF222)/HNH endonuclease
MGELGRSRDAAALREALDVVRDRVDALVAGFEGLGDAQRWDALAAVGELVRAGDGSAVRVAGLLEQVAPALDAPSLSRWFGYRSTGDALRHELGVTAGRAKGIVRVALAATPRWSPSGFRFEPRYPHVAAAIAEGLIGLDQARVIVERLEEGQLRAADDDLLAAEASLVADAVGGAGAGERGGEGRGYDDTPPSPPELLATVAGAWLQAIDPDGAEPREEQQLRERSFTLAQCGDGMFRGKVVLPPDQGAAVHAVLSAYRSPRTTRDGGLPGGEDERSPEQRGADVLAGLFAAHARSGDAPRPGKDSPTLLVAVTLADLDAHAAGLPGSCEIVETGQIVPVQLAARMTCDAFIQPALVDDDGHVLKLGRRKRLFNRAQRLAIILRDKHCLHCGAPASWDDVHHVRTWADGGDTDIDNGVLVCSRCHHEIHCGRLQLERAGTRWRIRRALLPPVRRPRGTRRPGATVRVGALQR